jgi:hypothetical protein
MSEVESVILVSFSIFSSRFVYCRRMRTYQHTAFTVLDRYEVLIAEHKSDAGVGVDF